MTELLFSAALFVQGALAPAGWCGHFLLTAYHRYGLSPVFRDGSSVWEPGDVVAVDPRFIPLGSWVSIDGLGVWHARDTGGGVHGLHLDLALPSHSAAVQFGRQERTACVSP